MRGLSLTLRLSLAACVLAALLSAGCQKSAPPPAPTPIAQPPVPMPATLETIAALRKSAPNLPIGRVTHLLPEYRLASVGDVPVKDFKVGQRVSFMGNDGFLTGGEVVRIVGDGLHVKWDVPPASGRAPIVGDLLIRVPAADEK